jgi:ATP-dependent helicase HrpA
MRLLPGPRGLGTAARPARPWRHEVDKARYAAIHRAVLSGYLSNIAVHKDRNIYTAAKSREVMVFPGSTLFGKNASWIVAAEMVKTSRLFARTAARVAPRSAPGGFLQVSYGGAPGQRGAR